MSLDLREFLTSGHLGELSLGLTEADVRRFIGEPWDTTAPGHPPSIWRYGALQLALDTGLVTAIGLYLGRSQDLPDALRLGGFVPSERTGVEEFKHYLRRIELECAQDEDLTFDSQLCLVVGIGVDVYFRGFPKLSLDSLQLTNLTRRRRLISC